jgi:hypothetical protein
MTSSLKKVVFFLLQSKRLGGRVYIRSSMMICKPPNTCFYDPACGPSTSNMWASSPMEAQARLVPPNMSTSWVLQRQMDMPSKDLKSKHHDEKIKSIKYPFKHVHPNHLIKIN